MADNISDLIEKSRKTIKYLEELSAKAQALVERSCKALASEISNPPGREPETCAAPTVPRAEEESDGGPGI